MHSSPLEATDDTTISRLLLIDKNTILVSSVHETNTGGIETEKAVFGRGFDNGIVVIARRLMATDYHRDKILIRLTISPRCDSIESS